MNLVIPYTKLVGAGNEFMLVDTLRYPLSAFQRQWPRVARRLCDRRRGPGADGLLVLGRSRRADLRMRIFNPDGTEPAMCGNGIRCLAWYAARHQGSGQGMTIETNAGVKCAQLNGTYRVRVAMGAPQIVARLPHLAVGTARKVDAVLVDSGVPHLVCWIKQVAAVDVEALGRRLRFLRRFQPEGVNVDFVERAAIRAHAILRLTVRTYERGVEAETRACGTGAVAAAAAAVDRVLAERRSGPWRIPGTIDVDVRVPGGRLRVRLKARRHANGRVVFSQAFLDGEARPVTQGTFLWNGTQ